MFNVTFIKRITGVAMGDIILGLDASLPFPPTYGISYRIGGAYIHDPSAPTWSANENRFFIDTRPDEGIYRSARNYTMKVGDIGLKVKEYTDEGWYVVSGWGDKKKPEAPSEADATENNGHIAG